MKYCVIDVESDGLLEDATVIHCLVWYDDEGKRGVLSHYDDMITFFSALPSDCAIVGHNIIRYDIPLCEKILQIKITHVLWDTLGVSWYLYPERLKHGLESYGEEFGIPKIEVKDWKHSSLQLYVERCIRDVEINFKLWLQELAYLQQIYLPGNEIRLLNYLSFKLDCAREQEDIKWKVDTQKCQLVFRMLTAERQKRVDQLSAAMPENITYKDIKKPAKMTKADGTPSAAALKWNSLLEELEVPEPENGVLTVEEKSEPGNPSSQTQLKDWLYGLGWKPATFILRKAKDNNIKNVPQISTADGLCKSVKLLAEIEPAIYALEGLFIINHRLGILKGFMENADKDGFVKAEIKGFTNTLRFQHTVVVNLPSIHKPYGKEIRGCLIAPDDDHILCGSDMTSLEDSTKQHYMFKYDPEYVKEMRSPDFDPHVDIGVLANMMTQEESYFYRWMDGKPIPENLIAQKYLDMTQEERKAEVKKLSKQRKDSKQVNFSAVYGAGPPKISLTTGMPLLQAQILHKIYWKRNWAVKKIAKSCAVKTTNGQMWLFNPVSRFWYSLRFDKDRFSTLNQGTGVFCFDTQVRNIRQKNYKICGQFHDEVIFPLHKDKQEQVKEDLQQCIIKTNEILKLNITLGISLDFGKSYSDIH